MAILNLTVDTEAKTCTATVDGKPLENIDRVTVYNYGWGDKPQFTFEVDTLTLEDGVRFRTSTSAADRSPGSAQAQASSLAPDLVSVRRPGEGSVVEWLSELLAATPGGDS